MLFGFVYSPRQRYSGENLTEIKTAVCGRDTVNEVMNSIGFRTVTTRTEAFDDQDEVFLLYGKVVGIDYPIAWIALSGTNIGNHAITHVARWKRVNGAWTEIPIT